MRGDRVSASARTLLLLVPLVAIAVWLTVGWTSRAFGPDLPEPASGPGSTPATASITDVPLSKSEPGVDTGDARAKDAGGGR